MLSESETEANSSGFAASPPMPLKRKKKRKATWKTWINYDHNHFNSSMLNTGSPLPSGRSFSNSFDGEASFRSIQSPSFSYVFGPTNQLQSSERDPFFRDFGPRGGFPVPFDRAGPPSGFYGSNASPSSSLASYELDSDRFEPRAFNERYFFEESALNTGNPFEPTPSSAYQSFEVEARVPPSYIPVVAQSDNPLPADNVGFKMLQKMGYREGILYSPSSAFFSRYSSQIELSYDSFFLLMKIGQGLGKHEQGAKTPMEAKSQAPNCKTGLY